MFLFVLFVDLRTLLLASECSSRNNFSYRVLSLHLLAAGWAKLNTYIFFHLLYVQFGLSSSDGGAADGATSSVYKRTNAWSVLLPKHLLYIRV